MTEPDPERLNVAPGEPHDSMLSETISYVVGLGMALVLTGIAVEAWRRREEDPLRAA